MDSDEKLRSVVIFCECDWAGNIRGQKQASEFKVALQTQFFWYKFMIMPTLSFRKMEFEQVFNVFFRWLLNTRLCKELVVVRLFWLAAIPLKAETFAEMIRSSEMKDREPDCRNCCVPPELGLRSGFDLRWISPDFERFSTSTSAATAFADWMVVVVHLPTVWIWCCRSSELTRSASTGTFQEILSPFPAAYRSESVNWNNYY